MRRYATYFDSFYLPRARVLFASLDRHDPSWRASVLALDEACEASLRALGRDNLEIVPLAELEADEPRLAPLKAERSRIEYYFSAGPAFLDMLLRRHGGEDGLTYVDADLCFYSPPDDAYAELAGKSVGLVEHKLSARNHGSHAAGLYNVGWLWFRQDADGRAAVAWWKERCLEWCFDRFEAGRYADQKYLESMPGLFGNVHSVAHPGLNLAPWNVDRAGIRAEGGALLVDGRPLIAYHMHGLKQVGPRLFKANGAEYGARFWGPLRELVYRPYLAELGALAEGAAAAGQIRYPAGARGLKAALRAVKHAVWNGSYLFRAFGRFW